MIGYLLDCSFGYNKGNVCQIDYYMMYFLASLTSTATVTHVCAQERMQSQKQLCYRKIKFKQEMWPIGPHMPPVAAFGETYNLLNRDGPSKHYMPPALRDRGHNKCHKKTNVKCRCPQTFTNSKPGISLKK